MNDIIRVARKLARWRKQNQNMPPEVDKASADLLRMLRSCAMNKAHPPIILRQLAELRDAFVRSTYVFRPSNEINGRVSHQVGASRHSAVWSCAT